MSEHSAGGTIDIEYGASDAEQVDDIAFARQLRFEVSMTVHRTLEATTMTMQRLQVPLAGEPLRSTDVQTDKLVQRAAIDPAVEASLRAIEEEQHCLLAIDVRNVFGLPFEVAFERTSAGASLLAMPL